jgi:hypothetical protein
MGRRIFGPRVYRVDATDSAFRQSVWARSIDVGESGRTGNWN